MYNAGKQKVSVKLFFFIKSIFFLSEEVCACKGPKKLFCVKLLIFFINGRYQPLNGKQFKSKVLWVLGEQQVTKYINVHCL